MPPQVMIRYIKIKRSRHFVRILTHGDWPRRLANKLASFQHPPPLRGVVRKVLGGLAIIMIFSEDVICDLYFGVCHFCSFKTMVLAKNISIASYNTVVEGFSEIMEAVAFYSRNYEGFLEITEAVAFHSRNYERLGIL